MEEADIRDIGKMRGYRVECSEGSYVPYPNSIIARTGSYLISTNPSKGDWSTGKWNTDPLGEKAIA